MKIPQNTFRDALKAGQPQIGCWVGFASPDVAEALAGCGFDWLLLDGEHAPNDPRTVLDQLRAVAPYATHPVVRAVEANVALVKQYLDVGAQTLLIPMVDTAEQAALMVRATRYAPEGIRGMGAALARASRWNQVDDYLNQANGQMCLLVQAETVAAVKNLKAIAETEGVDGVFFGPADLSASMGHIGQFTHPAVLRAMGDAARRCKALGKPVGTVGSTPDVVTQYRAMGFDYLAISSDMGLLMSGALASVKALRGLSDEPHVHSLQTGTRTDAGA